jgi:hypothetical protein
LDSELTETVIGSAFEILRVQAAGFCEKVDERALLRELMLRGVSRVALLISFQRPKVEWKPVRFDW